MSGHLKSKLTNKRIILIYYLIIFILTSYATYKNGIILYQKHLINFISIFKPLLLISLSIVLSYLINYLYSLIKKDNYNFKEDYTPIFMALITLTLPLNIGILLFLLIMLIANILKLFYNIEFINYYNLVKVLFVLLLLIIGKYSYLTLYDTNIETNLTSLDLFLGKGIGALGTSNILLILICYLVMLFLNESYKKEIPIISMISYLITLIIFDLIIKNNVVLDIKNLFTNGFIFGVIFIATIPMYSPIKYKSVVLYSVLIGIISFIINKFYNIYDSIFIAVFIANIIIVIYELLERKILHGHKRI